MTIADKDMKFKNKNPNSNIIKYPVKKSRITKGISYIILCAIPLVVIILLITSLVLFKNSKISVNIEEEITHITEEETTLLVEEETTRLVEEETTYLVEEETTRLVEEKTTPLIDEETTQPIEEKPEQPKDNQFVSYNAYTVAIGWHLLTVSNNQKQVNITSTDKTFEVCNIILKENFNEPITGTALGDKIVILSVTKRRTVDTFRYIEYTILYFDPVQCTYKALPIIEDKLSISKLEFLPAVFSHQDTLDVFFPSETICFPCRFNANGNKVEIKHQIQPVQSETFGQFHLQIIKRSKTNFNYAYGYKYYKGSYIEILDQDFNEIRRIPVGLHMDVIAVNSDTDVPYVGIYYADSDHPLLYTYILYYFETPIFESLFRLIVPLSEGHITQTASISIDLLGNSYVTVIECLEIDVGRNIILLRYGRTGRLLSKIELKKLEDYKKYDVQAIMLDANRYCLAVHELSDYKPGSTSVKCYNVAEMGLD